VLKELDTNIRWKTISAVKRCLSGESSTNRGHGISKGSLSRGNGGARPLNKLTIKIDLIESIKSTE
jgi:hypothetical protein